MAIKWDEWHVKCLGPRSIRQDSWYWYWYWYWVLVPFPRPGRLPAKRVLIRRQPRLSKTCLHQLDVCVVVLCSLGLVGDRRCVVRGLALYPKEAGITACERNLRRLNKNNEAKLTCDIPNRRTNIPAIPPSQHLLFPPFLTIISGICLILSKLASSYSTVYDLH